MRQESWQEIESESLLLGKAVPASPRVMSKDKRFGEHRLGIELKSFFQPYARKTEGDSIHPVHVLRSFVGTWDHASRRTPISQSKKAISMTLRHSN